MKRFLLIGLILGLCAGQSSADFYTPDQSTIESMTVTSLGSNTSIDPLTVNTNTPSSPWTEFSTEMTYTAGDDGQASVSIGVTGSYGDLSSYEGYALNFLNTNNSEWFVQLYIKGTSLDATSSSVSILPPLQGGAVTGVALDFTGLTVTNVTEIGFWVIGNMDKYPYSYELNPSNPDDFMIAVSPVPIPATILLGLLGLGIGGWKLRKSV